MLDASWRISGRTINSRTTVLIGLRTLDELAIEDLHISSETTDITWIKYCISRPEPSTYLPPGRNYLTLTESDTLDENLDTASGVGAEHERLSRVFQVESLRRAFE